MSGDIHHEISPPLRTRFEECVLPLRDFLFTNALHLTGNFNDAEDLIQDTFALCLRKFHLYEQGTNLKAWIARMQFNLYISQYRRRRRRPDAASIAGMEDTVSDTCPREVAPELLDMPPDAMLSHRPFMDELPIEMRRGLAELDQRYRDVLLMNVIGEKSYKDIAASLAVPVGTVMSRLSRAKACLRKFFATTEAGSFSASVRPLLASPEEQLGV